MTDTATTEATPSAAQIDRIIELETQVTEYRNQIERITQRLHQFGDDQDYCAEFDTILQEYGLEPRARPTRLVVQWQVTFSTYQDVGRVSRTVRDNTDWSEHPSIGEMAERISNLLYGQHYLDLGDVEVEAHEMEVEDD